MMLPNCVIEFGGRSEGNTQGTQYLHRVHQKSFKTFREKSILTELSNFRYIRQMIASGNGLSNFNSI